MKGYVHGFALLWGDILSRRIEAPLAEGHSEAAVISENVNEAGITPSNLRGVACLSAVLQGAYSDRSKRYLQGFQNMGVLSEFFERTNLKGRLFFAGTVEGTLVLEKPTGVVFVHLIERGRLDLVYPEQRCIEISQPSVVLSPSSCRYQLRAHESKGADLICACFQFGRSGEHRIPLGLTKTLIFPYRDLEQIGSVIAALAHEFHTPAPGRSKALNLLLEYTFVLLVRRAVSCGLIARGLLYALQHDLLGPALICIHQEPQLDWSVERLADVAKVSRTKFAELFSEVMGMPPMTYVTTWRMQVAQDLLREGKPIKVIADAVGFASQALFTRTFTEQVGQSPGEWLRTSGEAPRLQAQIYRD